MDDEIGEYELINCDYSEEEEIDLSDIEEAFFFGGEGEGQQITHSEYEEDCGIKGHLCGDTHVETSRTVSTHKAAEVIDEESLHLSER